MSLIPIHRLYPRARDNRLPLSHPEVKAARVKFLKAAGLNFVIIIVLFFGLFCYLFGALYEQEARTNHLNILWVDYDNGAVGDAVRHAYSSLQSRGFPTLIEKAASEFPTRDHLWETVCRTNYWAALYTSPGASASLASAISGSNSTPYNASNILSYIWNEARYPMVVDSLVSSSLETLSDAARTAYLSFNDTAAFNAIPPDDSHAMSAFINPWTLTSYNIQPMTQGARLVYNTLVIVLVLIQDFFYLAIINGLYVQFKIYTRAPPTCIILVRNAISVVFTLFGALLLACAIWAFRGNWSASGEQFALTWLILWLFAHSNFLTFDVFSIWLPPQYISMALISWVILNVTSILIPFALSSPFYRWSYAMPAHAAYEALTDTWSNGCNPHLGYALPVLFAYEVSGLFWTALGVYKRCHCAVIAEESTQEAMRLRVEAALKTERGRHHHHLQREVSEKTTQNGDANARGPVNEDRRGGDLGQHKSRQSETEDERDVEALGGDIERMETRATRNSNFGPSFHLVGGGAV